MEELLKKINDQENKIRYTLMLEPSLLSKLKFYAESAELAPGTLIRNIIKSGMEEVDLFHKAGIIRIIGSNREQLDKAKRRLKIG